MKAGRAVMLGVLLVVAFPLIVAVVWDFEGPVRFLWLRTLMFGRGAVINPEPASLSAGQTFFQAEESLNPVHDSMSVSVGFGPVTDAKKDAVLQGTLKPAAIETAVCTSRTDCAPLHYSGLYLSEDTYGMVFAADGFDRKTRFVGVRVSVDRPLTGVVISWSNYAQ